MKQFGKFRGVVTDSNDPLAMGRVRAVVPSLFGQQATAWAMPCFSAGAIFTGGLCVPSIGTNVWIEFEGGDPNFPIWVGWFVTSAGELPSLLVPSAEPASAKEGCEDARAGSCPENSPIVLTGPGGATLRIDSQGICLENAMGAKLELIGPAIVMNGGALEVV